MPKPFQSQLTDEQLRHLEEERDRAKYPVQYARVKGEALEALLRDHYELHRILKTGQ